MAGLLDDPLMHMALGLLANSGPSTQPRPIGAGLLQGAQLSNQARQANAFAQRAETQDKYANAQLGQLERRQNALSALTGGYDPGSGITWASGRQGQSPQEREALVAQAFPEQFGQAQVASMFPNAGAPETFGAPVPVQKDGRTMFVQFGSRGTQRPVEGYQPPPERGPLPTAPMQNFDRRQQLVAQFGEGSTQVQSFDSMVRAPQFRDVGGSVDVFNGVNPSAPPIASIPKTLPPEQTPQVKGEQAAAAASGRVQGETTAQAKIDLPKIEQQADYMVKLLDGLTSHPGMSDVVGAKGNGALPMYLGMDPIAGTKAADFKARLDQVQGQQFLQAFETLKGGGQITEVEGNKAQNAIARMQTAQTEREFVAAANEFKGVIQMAVGRARTKSGGVPLTAGPAQTANNDPLGIR